jgi:hypothetical protein
MQKIEDHHVFLFSIGPDDFVVNDEQQCVLEIEDLIQVNAEPDVEPHLDSEQYKHHLSLANQAYVIGNHQERPYINIVNTVVAPHNQVHQAQRTGEEHDNYNLIKRLLGIKMY